MRLTDTTVVVTGGASGLGAAMTRRFTAEGANVVACDVNAEHLAEVAAETADDPGTVTDVVADVTEWDDVQELVQTARDAHGAIDVFVTNAALRQYTITSEDPKPVHEVEVNVWDQVLAVNLRGAFLCTKAALPAMREDGAGRLLYVSSNLGHQGRANRVPYTASKFGLEGLCESLALELDGTGVDVVRFRPPSGGDRSGVFTRNIGDHGRSKESFGHEPDVVSETAVQLAAGAGEHGGQYVVTNDGTGFVDDPLAGD